MMTSIAFDTLAYSKTLQSVGMPREQADAMTQAQVAAIREMVAAPELVTKQDLYVALAESKNEILKWVMAIALAQTTLLTAVIAFMR